MRGADGPLLRGDTTEGLASVGGVFDVASAEEGEGKGEESAAAGETGTAGHLGSVVADAEGHAVIPSRVIDGGERRVRNLSSRGSLFS